MFESRTCRSNPLGHPADNRYHSTNSELNIYISGCDDLQIESTGIPDWQIGFGLQVEGFDLQVGDSICKSGIRSASQNTRRKKYLAYY